MNPSKITLKIEEGNKTKGPFKNVIVKENGKVLGKVPTLVFSQEQSKEIQDIVYELNKKRVEILIPS